MFFDYSLLDFNSDVSWNKTSYPCAMAKVSNRFRCIRNYENVQYVY